MRDGERLRNALKKAASRARGRVRLVVKSRRAPRGDPLGTKGAVAPPDVSFRRGRTFVRVHGIAWDVIDILRE